MEKETKTTMLKMVQEARDNKWTDEKIELEIYRLEDKIKENKEKKLERLVDNVKQFAEKLGINTEEAKE